MSRYCCISLYVKVMWSRSYKFIAASLEKKKASVATDRNLEAIRKLDRFKLSQRSYYYVSWVYLFNFVIKYIFLKKKNGYETSPSKTRREYYNRYWFWCRWAGGRAFEAAVGLPWWPAFVSRFQIVACGTEKQKKSNCRCFWICVPSHISPRPPARSPRAQSNDKNYQFFCKPQSLILHSSARWRKGEKHPCHIAHTYCFDIVSLFAFFVGVIIKCRVVPYTTECFPILEPHSPQIDVS